MFAYKFSHALTFETYTITQGRFDMHYLVVWLERILKWNTAFSNTTPSFYCHPLMFKNFHNSLYCLFCVLHNTTVFIVMFSYYYLDNDYKP